MAPKRRIINRECKNKTCSRRDSQDEPQWHSLHQDGPLIPASPDTSLFHDTRSPLDDTPRATVGSREDHRDVRDIIKALDDLKNGRITATTNNDRATFSLLSTHFELLQHLLDDEIPDSRELARWYHRRARYDYEASLDRYTLRMPTAVHECFTASVVNAVDRAINDLVQRQLTARRSKMRLARADALKRIFKGGSTTVLLDDAESYQSDGDSSPISIRRSPDASFYHHDAAELPQMVVEVGYSQKGRQLDRIAESYIVDSKHAIHCVLGFDIPYVPRSGSSTRRTQVNNDRTATFSVWRPLVVPAAGDEWEGVAVAHHIDVPFRHRDGTAADGHLALFVGDVLPQATLDTLPKDFGLQPIVIPLSNLAEALDAAEQCQATIDARPVRSPARPSPQSTPTSFRKRKRTPSPALCDERERDYIKQEAAELKRDRKQDRTWRSPSSNRIVWHDVKRRRSPRNSLNIKAEPDVG